MDQGRARALGAALLALVGCVTAGGETRGGEAAGGGSKQIGAPAPAIRVESMSGKALALDDYRGKVVLLDVWASWCGPCKQELPMLDDMAKRLRGDGIEVLAVSVDQERANVVKFLKARPRWSLTIAHDPKGEIADRLAPEKMPTSYVIDREGIVRYVNSGFEPSDAAVIERRLVETARR
ncbi:MAG TPA: TlpA disulfide reductase family protein [Polyangia bacterium]|nr:TlpA disulfide reductase family protein [Polyangia bacterium]